MATATQTVELVGGPRDGEVWLYDYTGNPTFSVQCESISGVPYLYHMCSDGKFRLERHVTEFERQRKKGKKKKW